MRYSRKKIKKLSKGKCFFCDLDTYEALDVHRIVAGCNDGRYEDGNCVVVCASCHRLIHSGAICIDKKYMSTKGYVLHYWQDGKETWKYTGEYPTYRA